MSRSIKKGTTCTCDCIRCTRSACQAFRRRDLWHHRPIWQDPLSSEQRALGLGSLYTNVDALLKTKSRPYARAFSPRALPLTVGSACKGFEMHAGSLKSILLIHTAACPTSPVCLSLRQQTPFSVRQGQFLLSQDAQR